MGNYNLDTDILVGDPAHTQHHIDVARAVNDLDDRVTALAPDEPLDLTGTPLFIPYGLNLDTVRPNIPAGRVGVWFGTGMPVNAVPGDMVWSTTPIVGGGTGPGDGFVGFLDGKNPVYRAHSLRRLSSLYLGDAIRIRRSSDNTEANIGFNPDGTLNSGAMSSFVGSDSAFCTTLFDQSGNGRHLLQATSAFQPRVANAGALELVNGKPALYFDGIDDYMAAASTGLYAAGASTTHMVHKLVPDVNDSPFGEYGPNTSNAFRMFRNGAGAATSPLFRSSATLNNATPFSVVAAAGDTTWDGNQHESFLVFGSGLVNYWRDSIRTLTDVAAAHGTGAENLLRTTLGGSGYNTPTGFVTGHVQELIAWATNETAIRNELYLNSKAAWGTP